jgi:uncharacterized repeat protein (TIGR01451 family)
VDSGTPGGNGGGAGTSAQGGQGGQGAPMEGPQSAGPTGQDGASGQGGAGGANGGIGGAGGGGAGGGYYGGGGGGGGEISAGGGGGGGSSLVPSGGSTGTDTTRTPLVTISYTAVPVSNKADIRAGLSCPASLAVGQSGTCTLTVTNAGPALATRVVAGAVVPAALKVTGCSGGCSRSGGTLGWSLGSLPAGQSDPVTISVTAARAGSALVAAADGAANPDPNLLNNAAAATVKVTKLGFPLRASPSLRMSGSGRPLTK